MSLYYINLKKKTGTPRKLDFFGNKLAKSPSPLPDDFIIPFLYPYIPVSRLSLFLKKRDISRKKKGYIPFFQKKGFARFEVQTTLFQLQQFRKVVLNFETTLFQYCLIPQFRTH